MKTAKSWASSTRGGDINDNYYRNKNKSSTISSYSNQTIKSNGNGISSVDTKLSYISRKVESILGNIYHYFISLSLLSYYYLLAESKDDNENRNSNEILRNSLRDSIGNGTNEILFKAMKEIKYKKADAKHDGSLSARYESKDDDNKSKMNKQFSSDDIDAMLLDAAKEVMQNNVSKSISLAKSIKKSKSRY